MTSRSRPARSPRGGLPNVLREPATSTSAPATKPTCDPWLDDQGFQLISSSGAQDRRSDLRKGWCGRGVAEAALDPRNRRPIRSPRAAGRGTLTPAAGVTARAVPRHGSAGTVPGAPPPGTVPGRHRTGRRRGTAFTMRPGGAARHGRHRAGDPTRRPGGGPRRRGAGHAAQRRPARQPTAPGPPPGRRRADRGPGRCGRGDHRGRAQRGGQRPGRAAHRQPGPAAGHRAGHRDRHQRLQLRQQPAGPAGARPAARRRHQPGPAARRQRVGPVRLEDQHRRDRELPRGGGLRPVHVGHPAGPARRPW